MLSINRATLKSDAKSQLKGNWALAVFTCFIFSLITGFTTYMNFDPDSSFTLIVDLFTVILSGAFLVGMSRFSLNFAENKNPKFTDLFSGFKLFFKALGLFLLFTISVSIGFLLFIIPGIILTFMFSQTFYILADNPKTSIMDCLQLSAKMMKGYKFDYFVLQLSFIGWGLLCGLTFGIGFLWLYPYIEVTNANFYKKVSEGYINSGEYDLH